ncbi:MAG: apolipoprotein N-acyltransferase [Rhizobiaceae bacterium]
MERLAGRIILLWGWRRLFVAFLAGALAVLSAAPYDFFAVCFVSFPVLVWLLDGAATATRRTLAGRLLPAFATGWWFGFGYFVAGLWWVGKAMLVEADAYAWAVPIGVLVLPAIMALFYGLAAALARLVRSDGIGRIAALAAAFALCEWLRTFVFTGFPWNPIGYAAMPIPPLMQSVALVGMPGINALAVFVFAMPALLAARRHLRTGLALALIVIAAHAGYGYWRVARPAPEQSRALALRIVQPAIDQSEKWDTEVRDRIFKTLLDLSAAPSATGQPRPELIVWPETSVPFLITDKPQALVAIADLLSDGQMLLAGVVRGERDPSAPDGARFYNAVAAIHDRGEIVDAVDKVHLVPGGEYLPFAELFAMLGIEQIVAGPGGFYAGAERHPISIADGVTAAAFICYEIIFPELVAADVGDANLILNVTNDAWFGNSPGPYQHLRQAQIRAVEAGRPLVRAANTGISAVIDARGRILDALALDTRGALDLSLAVARETPPIRWNPMLVGAILCALMAAAALATARRRGAD